MCEKRNIPRMFFVTDMDDDKASYREIVQELQEMYGKKIAPFHLPIRENEQFVGYVNVIQQKAKRWNDKGTVDKFDVPDYSQDNLAICRDALLEAVEYCGVSPVQIGYFTEYISNQEDWELIEVYYDEGITGTSTKKRDGFNRMIADCEAGKIDVVYNANGKISENHHDSHTKTFNNKCL
jgi:elongation factor G